MNLLLDTHVALWAITDSPRLTAAARQLLVDPENTLWVSVASLWEITIKHHLARGNMPLDGADALKHFRQSGYRILPIEAQHTLAVAGLAAHHQDPFDRLLVAQALSEPLRLVTHDALLARYSDSILLI